MRDFSLDFFLSFNDFYWTVSRLEMCSISCFIIFIKIVSLEQKFQTEIPLEIPKHKKWSHQWKIHHNIPAILTKQIWMIKKTDTTGKQTNEWMKNIINEHTDRLLIANNFLLFLFSHSLITWIHHVTLLHTIFASFILPLFFIVTSTYVLIVRALRRYCTTWRRYRTTIII